MEFPHRPARIVRALNLQEARQEFGLSVRQIYRAVERGELRAIQPGGKGRIYYLADELEALARRLSSSRGLKNEAAA